MLESTDPHAQPPRGVRAAGPVRGASGPSRDEVPGPERPAPVRRGASYVRGFSTISQVSITSSILMSLYDPRPMPHS